MLRRRCTPEDADRWTREDWIAILLSPLAYVLLMLGTAWTLLLRPIGFLILGAGILTTFLMHWVIDPKLKMISENYQEKQKKYLKKLEETLKWTRD